MSTHKSTPVTRARASTLGQRPSQPEVTRTRALSLSELPSPPPVTPQRPATPRERTPSMRERVLRSFSFTLSLPHIEEEEPLVEEEPPVSPRRPPTSLDLRKLLDEVGVDLGNVEFSARSKNWAEIVRAAEKVVPDSDPVELAPGSKLPELLVRAVLDADYDDDAACRLICRFHPLARAEALVLLMSQLAAGPMPASGQLQEAVQAAVRETCTYFVKTDQKDELLWLLQLCPEQFRPPCPLSAHTLYWACDTCAGLLLEYAKRGWDAQLGTTMEQLATGPEPMSQLLSLATLASMIFAHGGGDPKSKCTEVALGIYNSVGEVFGGTDVHQDAFLQKVSPQLLSAVNRLPPPHPDMFEDRSLVDKKWRGPAQLQSDERPELLRERLRQDTGIMLTILGWSMQGLPRQWDGLLTYLRDAALLNPGDPELVKLAVHAAKAACAAIPLPSHMASTIVKNWVHRLGDMGSVPELDQLRRALSDESSMMLPRPPVTERLPVPEYEPVPLVVSWADLEAPPRGSKPRWPW
jgi:hypothetical protein